MWCKLSVRGQCIQDIWLQKKKQLLICKTTDFHIYLIIIIQHHFHFLIFTGTYKKFVYMIHMHISELKN